MNRTATETALALENPPQPELVQTRDLIYQVAGIFHPDNKLSLLFDRCSRRMKLLKCSSLAEYLDCLVARPTRQTELTALLNEITIGETCFFRNQAQLEAFREVVLPRILQARSTTASRRLRIWSAGCSTGEEPYTLRMLLLEESQRVLKNWTFEILATDLNERSLAHARAGIFGSHSTRRLAQPYRDRYFIPSGEKFQLKAGIRTGVNFSRLNLSDDARMASMKAVDAIFCCNVLIYFDLKSKRRVLERFHKNLLPHGYLFLGQSESLYKVSNDFRLVHLPGTTAYVKADRP
jgi:chemotaxis protein methyltransferase CheR